MMQYAACMAALPLLAAAPLATGVDALSALELREHCMAYAEDPRSKSAGVCEAYVRGFVAGFTAADPSDAAPEQSERESFSDRALRTRLGAAALQRAQCRAESASLEEIIGQLLAHAAEDPPAESTSAAEIVDAALRRFQVCGERPDES